MKHALRAGVALGLAAASAPAFIVPDTVDLRSVPAWTYPPPSNFIVNASSDSLIIDSLSIGSSRIGGEMAHLNFWLRKESTSNINPLKGIFVSFSGSATVHQSWIVYSPQSARIAVAPNTVIQISDAYFDYCHACPTAKRTALAATSAIGDTLKARVVFHSGAGKDSVLFLGIQKISTAIMPSRAGRKSPTIFGRFDLFDLNGRKMPLRITVPGTLAVPAR